MPDYIYKGFKIHYEIPVIKTEHNLYEAYGYFLIQDQDKITKLPKFHTLDASKKAVRMQIKKIIEDYIDFDWQKLGKIQQARKV